MDFHNHQDLGPLFASQKKTQGKKRAAAVPQTQPKIKRRRYVAADSYSDSRQCCFVC